jgi:DNA primase
MPTPTWINFKELREHLSFEQVLGHYKVPLNLKRDGQHLGPCPLPGHAAQNRSPSFSANLTRRIFQCFGCKAKGNVLDFAALMERADPKDGAALRKVAAKMQDLFCKPEPPPELPMVSESSTGKAVINAPLDFELKGLDSSHPILRERGILSETAKFFGLGVASKGLLKDRLAIPLHDAEGKLVGYAGRILYDHFVTDENPRYLFPDRRERQGVLHEFRKSRFLYNGFGIGEELPDLFIVEGFPSVWWLHQSGFPPTVATMGPECSTEQAELIVSLTTHRSRVWVMPNGDSAGQGLAESVLAQVSPYRFVRWVRLEENQQPTDLSETDLAERFAW